MTTESILSITTTIYNSVAISFLNFFRQNRKHKGHNFKIENRTDKRLGLRNFFSFSFVNQ